SPHRRIPSLSGTSLILLSVRKPVNARNGYRILATRKNRSTNGANENDVGGRWMSDQVAVIGIGAMGLVLLKRLRALGTEVRAFDVSPSAMQKARDAGGHAATSPADAARGASHIHVIVTSDEQLIGVTLGPDGVLMTASPGTLVFLHSTVMPE